MVWERTATEATPHEGFHSQYGSFVSYSPVTDGKHVFAYFGSLGVYCYDLDGHLIWKKDLGQIEEDPAVWGRYLNRFFMTTG